MIAGIMEDMELRIHAKQLLQTILHGEDATDNHCTASLYVGLACENLRKSFHHSLGDTLVLQSAQGCQFAIPSLGILTYQDYLTQGFLALGCQLAFLFRLQQ